MINQTIIKRGICDLEVIAAMRKVPRHQFVSAIEAQYAYHDRPLPIDHGQTISQPFMVAFMVQAARLQKGASKVLEIGTGSGYGAAVIAEIAAKVYSIEIIEDLANTARIRLEQLGYRNVSIRIGDGSVGWPEEQPFDAIIVTAAPSEIPNALLTQLKADGGRLIIPVGEGENQMLQIIEREDDKYHTHSPFAVRFVPMTGNIN
jgi:protein-L-isoaspartate(D-aspartate) O-methyltransferase